jgi:two-component system response regulator FixJ
MLRTVIGQSASGSGSRRVYVVDDDDAFRSSLIALLDSAGWETQGFGSLQEFADATAGLEPGILLLDLNLDGASGLDFLESPRAELDRFAVVMVTGAGEIEIAVRAMKAGAADFVEKPFEPAQLLDRLDEIHARFAAGLRDRMMRAEARKRVAALSGREHDVLERLISGASNKLIARELDLSPRTVEMHRARMLDKLGVATTAEALHIGRLAGMEPAGAARADGRTPESI